MVKTVCDRGVEFGWFSSEQYFFRQFSWICSFHNDCAIKSQDARTHTHILLHTNTLQNTQNNNTQSASLIGAAAHAVPVSQRPRPPAPPVGYAPMQQTMSPPTSGNHLYASSESGYHAQQVCICACVCVGGNGQGGGYIHVCTCARARMCKPTIFT